MDSELRTYITYSRNVRGLLRFSGLWPNSHPVVSRCLAYAALFSHSVVALTVLNFCIHYASDIMILTKGMGLVISMCTSCLKICIFLLHHKDLAYLNDSLTRRYTQDLENREDRPRLLTRVAPFSSILYTLVITGYLTILMYSIIPLFAWRKYGKYLRMYPAIYPFSYKPGGVVHWMLYGLELVAGMFLCSVTAGVDCCFGMYSMQICGELRILAKRFESLRSSDDYKINFKHCIERHHMIVNSKNRLERTFGLLSIWIAVSAGTVLCTLIFQFTEAIKVRSTSLHMGVMSMYIILKFLQVFTYAWYGDIIAEESELCLRSMYNAHWTDSYDAQLKNDVLIVLAQKPIVLKARGCMVIQLDMFTKIVNATVSYFFLLQTLNDESQK